MQKLFRFLRYVVAVVLLTASLTLLGGWWIVRRSLPQLDGTASLAGLRQEVTVDRDGWGVPRIRAGSLEDLLTAQGYVLAQDRLWQMDLLRRAAAGELSEIFGPMTLPLDRENRILGVRIAAERTAAEMNQEQRAMLEAYARGVNLYIGERRDRLPWEFRVLGYQPRPWTPTDSLLVGGYLWKELTSSWRSELLRAEVTERVGAERARDLYETDSPLDHFVVGSTAAAGGRVSRMGAAARVAGTCESSSGGARRQMSRPALAGFADPETERRAGPGLAGEALASLEQFGDEMRGMAGSNNWVIAGTHTYSGKPILANDTHLQLEVPSIWYLIHLTAPGWNVKGFTVPGAPLVIIGHNERIAWGFTNHGADVQDLYIETFNPENPEEYRVNGRWVKAERRKEPIRVKGRADHTLEVVVTRHGPIVHREAGRGYALRWVATDPGGMAFGVPLLGRAQNWQEFRAALRNVPGPAQNAVYADVDGNIGYLVGARIPVRKKGTGGVPVPGDADDYEWTGYIPFDELLQALNPEGGVIATANARVAGPGYRWHLTENWMPPYRTARIYTLLAETKKHRPADSIRIQTDIVSLPHQMLVPPIIQARGTPRFNRADFRVRKLVRMLPEWDGRATAGSIQTAFLEYTRRALLANLLRPYLGEQTNRYQWWRANVFLENVVRERPARWLPPNFSSYDELLIASAEEAVRKLEADNFALGYRNPANASEWYWGRFIKLQMLHPLARTGFLRQHLSMAGIAQSGTGHTVKQTGRTFGPSMRLVADLANLDNSMMNITMGQSGQYLSRHFRDQFPEWYEGRGIASPFSDAAQEKVRIHRLRLVPSSSTTR